MMNGFPRWSRGAILAVALGATAAAGGAAAVEEPAEREERPRETADRISSDRLEAMVAGPARLIERGDFDGAERAFEALHARRTRSGSAGRIAAADRLMPIAIEFQKEGSDDAHRRSARYLERSIGAYRIAFGSSHPEVALALASYADVLKRLGSRDPPREADAAVEEAYRIRLASLGPRNIETLTSLVALAELRGFASRTGGDPARIVASAELFRTALQYAVTDDSRNAFNYGRYGISMRMAEMYARNGLVEEALAIARDVIPAEYGMPAADEFGMCNFIGARESRLYELLQERGDGAAVAELGRLLNGGQDCTTS